MQESKREKYNYYNYLNGLVKSLENKHTIIDLRNESCVSGLIKNVDGMMNVEMENVTFYDPRGQEYKFLDFYISARNIRYVHIPETLSPLELMQEQINRLTRVNVKQPAKDSFKTKRAKRYQHEVLQSLSSAQPGPSTSKM